MMVGGRVEEVQLCSKLRISSIRLGRFLGCHSDLVVVGSICIVVRVGVAIVKGRRCITFRGV
jgi:hypothetical protein